MSEMTHFHVYLNDRKLENSNLHQVFAVLFQIRIRIISYGILKLLTLYFLKVQTQEFLSKNPIQHAPVLNKTSKDPAASAVTIKDSQDKCNPEIVSVIKLSEHQETKINVNSKSLDNVSLAKKEKKKSVNTEQYDIFDLVNCFF